MYRIQFGLCKKCSDFRIHFRCLDENFHCLKGPSKGPIHSAWFGSPTDHQRGFEQTHGFACLFLTKQQYFMECHKGLNTWSYKKTTLNRKRTVYQLVHLPVSGCCFDPRKKMVFFLLHYPHTIQNRSAHPLEGRKEDIQVRSPASN